MKSSPGLTASQSGDGVVVLAANTVVGSLSYHEARELAEQLFEAANAAEIQRICGMYGTPQGGYQA